MDRTLHVAFHAMPRTAWRALRTVVNPKISRKNLEAILLQSIRTCALHSRLLLFRSYRPQSDDKFRKNVTVWRLLGFENGPRPTAVSHDMQNYWIIVCFRHNGGEWRLRLYKMPSVVVVHTSQSFKYGDITPQTELSISCYRKIHWLSLFHRKKVLFF